MRRRSLGFQSRFHGHSIAAKSLGRGEVILRRSDLEKIRKTVRTNRGVVARNDQATRMRRSIGALHPAHKKRDRMRAQACEPAVA